MTEPTFLNLTGGFVLVDDIRMVERLSDDSLLAYFRTKAEPVVILDPADIVLLLAWLENRSWKPDNE